jgi:hypothetical protein
MKNFQNLLLLIAGVFCGLIIGRYFTVLPVHADDRLSTGTSCIAEVPKSWGDFKGASDYGLAFEDQNGTIRFLLRPPCGSRYSSNATPSPAADLLLERK